MVEDFLQYKDIIADLEDDLDDLNEENKKLIDIIKKQEAQIDKLFNIINIYNQNLK